LWILTWWHSFNLMLINSKNAYHVTTSRHQQHPSSKPPPAVHSQAFHSRVVGRVMRLLSPNCPPSNFVVQHRHQDHPGPYSSHKAGHWNVTRSQLHDGIQSVLDHEGLHVSILQRLGGGLMREVGVAEKFRLKYSPVPLACAEPAGQKDAM